jgi:hypothetical protein
MPEDIFIPTADACMLLGCSINPASLHYHKIPHRKEFTSLYWSRNAIYALLKKRRLATKPPKNYLTAQQAQDFLHVSEQMFSKLIKREKIPCSIASMWVNRGFRAIRVYHIKNIKRLAAKLRFERNSFPPEGWLSINDVADYLHLGTQYARAICKSSRVRVRKIHPRLYLYNEDDVVALRKARTRAKFKLSEKPST